MLIFGRYFSRFGDHSQQVFYLVMISIILNVGFGTIIPYMPIFAVELGATPLLIGFIVFGFMGTLIGVSLMFVVRSIAVSMYFPALRSLQANLIPPKVRGKIMGRIQAYFNIGGIFDPIIGGSIYSLFTGIDYIIFGARYLGGAIPFA